MVGAPLYTIRSSTPADIPGERAMQQVSWLEIYPNDANGVSREWVEVHVAKWMSPEQLEVSRRYLKDSYDDTGQLRLNAVDESGDIVGFIHALRRVRANRNDYVEIGALYTDPATYGMGLGGELMRRALDWAKSQGVGSVELEVVAYNERAIRFYRKYNFEKIEGSESMYKEKMPTIRMKQQIRSEDEI